MILSNPFLIYRPHSSLYSTYTLPSIFTPCYSSYLLFFLPPSFPHSVPSLPPFIFLFSPSLPPSLFPSLSPRVNIALNWSTSGKTNSQSTNSPIATQPPSSLPSGTLSRSDSGRLLVCQRTRCRWRMEWWSSSPGGGPCSLTHRARPTSGSRTWSVALHVHVYTHVHCICTCVYVRTSCTYVGDTMYMHMCVCMWEI